MHLMLFKQSERCQAAKILFIAAILTLAAAAPVVTQDTVEHKRVLILFQGERTLEAQIIVENALRSTLNDKSRVPVEIYAEYLDSARTEITSYEPELVSLLKKRYADKHFDLIIAVTHTPLQLLLRNRTELFPNTPIVYLTHDQRNVADLNIPPDVTGVWGEINFKQNLDQALVLHPETKSVVVVSGLSEWDKYWLSKAQEDFRPYETRLQFNYLIGHTVAELKAELANLPPDTVVIFITNVLDRAGNTYENIDVLREISATSSAPIYGTTDAQLGNGIVGGNILSFQALGEEAAQVGLRVLAGEKPEAIAAHAIPDQPMFDWRQLERWGISEASLPKGSIIEYKQPTVWQQYRWYIIGFLVLITFETLLIGFLIYLSFRRRQAEAETLQLGSKIREIVSNVPGIVWETRSDPVSGERKTTFISDYVEKMLGYKPKEWLAQPAGFGLKLVHEDDKQRVGHESDEVVETGKEKISEFRWRAKDGRIRWVQNYLVPIFGDNGKAVGLRGVALDVTEQKIAEEKARQAEEKDKAILAAIPDLMFMQTLDGVYLDYHAADKSQLLVPPEQFLGKNVREIIPPALAERFLTCFSIANEGGEPQVLEYKLDIGGKEQYFEARMVRRGDKIISMVRNVTDRVNALDALIRSEKRFGTAFRANPQPMSITVFEDGRYVEANRSFLDLSGYSRDELLGRTSVELGIWDGVETRKAFIDELVNTGSLVNKEIHFHTKDGRVRTLLASAERLTFSGQDCLLIAANDITERHEEQQALQESELRFRLAQQAARVGTWEWNIVTGDSLWSEMIWELLGLGPGSCHPTIDLLLEMMHPEDRNRVFEKVSDVVAHGDEYDDEFRIVRQDSQIVWLASKGRVIRAEDGQPVRMIGVNIDITEEKLAADSLRESEERFRTMADTAPILIWLSDTSGRCIYVNQEWLNLTGRNFDSQLGYGWSECVHPDDLAPCREIIDSSYDHRHPFELEYRVRRFDGTYRWIVDRGTPRFSPAGEYLGYIGSCIDITERKESEQALAKANVELKELKIKLEAENIYLHQELRQDPAFGDIIGSSAEIKYVLFKVSQVAPTDATVLITGETGTGKELVARAIHDASPRNERPLIRVNCAALSPTLIESELFGHEKGSFTGAVGRKIGRFELANHGTLMLDEIGELPLDLQAKLLRVLQEGEFERVGSGHTIKTDVRVIALTNRDLRGEIERGKFREDLWYRLNVFPITTPALRDRRDDIPILADHFTKILSRKFGKDITAISPDTMMKLTSYPWPGNVRELANVIERAVINSRGNVLRIQDELSGNPAEISSSSAGKTLEQIERDHITKVLQDLNWRIDGPRGGARVLGINPSTLRTRMVKLGIRKPNGDHPD